MSVLQRAFDRVLLWILGLPPGVQVLAAVGFQLAVVLADYMLGRSISVSFFYLPPLLLVAWACSGFCASLFAIASAFTERALLCWGEYDSTVLVWNSLVRSLTFFAVITLLLALKRLIRRETEMARSDFLTGLMNSRAFYERLNEEIVRAHRSSSPFALAYVDCDNFKAVNDTYGHFRGDEVLKAVATTIRRTIRVTDAAARLGGDEFAVLFAGVSAETAEVAAGKLHGALCSMSKDAGLEIGFSMGIVTFAEPPVSANEIVGLADRLMYSVKSGSKGQFALQHG
jgi:diguanylate cyclase (GGDEF)-like protein